MSCGCDITDAFAFETITVSSTAIGPTTATRGGNADIAAASRALITVESNSIRLRYDGTNPTAAVGHLLLAGDSMVLEGEGNIAALKMIRVTSDASVSITYER